MSSLSAAVQHVGLGFGKKELVSSGCQENNFVIGKKRSDHFLSSIQW